jgi:PPOX class probable F420-dependent enzyme
MTMRVSAATRFAPQVERRLRDEEIIWLTTVRADGTPEPNPVWFYWDGSSFLIYGIRGSHKLDHIARNPRVSLNFNSDEHGENVAVFTGEARIESTSEPLDPSYLSKYRAGIQLIGKTPETFARDYGVRIRMTPSHARAL